MSASSARSDVLSAAAIREHLSRVLASAQFDRGQRQSAFLRFVVEKKLEGRQEEIKESEIAVQVYERRHQDYSSRTDPIVRVEASRLRSKLREYYVAEGATEPLRIELPKGTYVPLFVAQEPAPRYEAKPIPRQGKIPWMWAAGSVAILIGVAWLLMRPSAGSPAHPVNSKLPLSIAVLPLQAAVPIPGHPDLGDRVTESLIAELLQFSIPNWHSRTQVLRAAPGQHPPAEALFHGTVGTEGGRLRVTGSLEHAASGLVLWNGSIERELPASSSDSDLALNIAFSIADNMNLALMGRNEQELAAVFPDRAQSRHLWLAAEELWRQSDPESVRTAVPLLEQACRLDPNFAWAHASLAHAYIRAIGLGVIPENPYRTRAHEESATALQIGPYLGFAHASATRTSLLLDWDFQAADARCAVSLGYLSSTGTVRNQCAAVYSLAGRYDASDTLSRGTLLRMPQNAIPLTELAGSHYRRGRYAEAAGFAKRAVELRPQSPDARELFILANLENGNSDSALQFAREGEAIAGEAARFTALESLVLARKGLADAAARQLAHAEQIAGNTYGRVFLIRPYLALGKADNAARILEEAIRRRDPALLEMRLDPMIRKLDTGNLFERVRKLVRT